MSLAQYIATSVLTEGRSVSELCRSHGVSRSWVYELCRRYRESGSAGLMPRSKAPHRVPNRTSEALRDEIVALRAALGASGLYNGACTIADELAARGHTNIPSDRTIHRILREAGVVEAQPKKRPRSATCRFAAELPNECWQSDITHWQLCDGSQVEIINFLDDHSRLIVACVVVPVATAADIARVFAETTALYGNPASVLTDNGATYTARYRGGKAVLESVLSERGIVFKHGRPYHPQTQGKVERFHQTLKLWLGAQAPANTTRQLQLQLDTFIAYYNDRRRHRGIGRQTPRSVYEAKIKATPTLFATTHYRVRTDRVDSDGKITLRYRTRLLHLAIGRHHKRKPVLVLVADDDVRVITPDGELIARHTLDPARSYQPNELRDSTMF